MGNQVELRINFPKHMVEKNIWWSDVYRISGHFGNRNWRYLPSVRYKVYASFDTTSNEYVRWCWSLFPCRPAEVRCGASCVAQLFAKRPDAFLQLVEVFDALKGLEGLLDSPVEVLLFPPLSPPFQLGLLHQWISWEGVETEFRKANLCSLEVAFWSSPHRQAAFRVKLQPVLKRVAWSYLRKQES